MRWSASRWSVAVVVLVLLAAGAAARGAEFWGRVYLPNGQPARNAVLEGVVATYTSVEPAAEGEFASTAVGGGPYRITTDAQGQYRLRIPDQNPENVPAGARVRKTYEMLFYSPSGLGWARVGQPLGGVVPGAHLDIPLQEGDRLAGRVVGYPGGQPLAGVEVEASVGLPGLLGDGRQTAAKAVTDAEGRFRLSTSLPPNGCELRARPAGWARMETKTEPPPSETPAARTVEMRFVRPYTIRGHAFGADGKPLRHTPVGFSTAGFSARGPGMSGTGSSSGAGTTTDETGAFALPQEPWYSPYGDGPYLPHYVALASRLQGGEVARPVVVDATDPATQTIEVHFAAPTTITARQVDAGTGQPAVGVWSRLVPMWPNLPPEQWDELQDGLIDAPHSITKDDRDGRIVLRGVPPGEYQLRVGGWTIHELTPENGNAVPVTVRDGETVDVGTVRVTYVPHFGGQFSGLPWRPDPGSEGEVTAVLRTPGTVSPGGEAWVDLRAGGQYTVWANGRSGGTYDAVLIAEKDNTRYVTQVVHGLRLEDDAGVEGINLEFTRGASIHGQVVQADGKPAAGVPLSAQGVGGDAVMFGAYGLYGGVPAIGLGSGTDSKGEFALEGLLPGEYEVTAGAEPSIYGPPPTVRVQVGAGEEKRGVLLRSRGQ